MKMPSDKVIRALFIACHQNRYQINTIVANNAKFFGCRRGGCVCAYLLIWARFTD